MPHSTWPEISSGPWDSMSRADRAHTYLSMRLSNAGLTEAKHAGDALDTLRRERNRADYDLQKPTSQPHAQSHVEQARLIIETLGASSGEPTRTQLMDGVKKYERETLKENTWRM
ncbi:hypothetical protein AYO40_06350 [Planctomycetaceae bacterium SCGC AG-212-D15]|nr:hypothetical protein AYO40_06350 [Planctomycetaceae bacterium SCGC AG-212-D15]